MNGARIHLTSAAREALRAIPLDVYAVASPAVIRELFAAGLLELRNTTHLLTAAGARAVVELLEHDARAVLCACGHARRMHYEASPHACSGICNAGTGNHAEITRLFPGVDPGPACECRSFTPATPVLHLEDRRKVSIFGDGRSFPGVTEVDETLYEPAPSDAGPPPVLVTRGGTAPAPLVRVDAAADVGASIENCPHPAPRRHAFAVRDTASKVSPAEVLVCADCGTVPGDAVGTREEMLDQLCRLFKNDRAYIDRKLKWDRSGKWCLEGATLDPHADTLAAMRLGYAMAKAEQ